MDIASEFYRCLLMTDVPGIRKLWQQVSPHLPQPKDDDEALHTLHLARTKMKELSPSLKVYSEDWLKERETRQIVHAVGISVGFHGEKDRKKVEQALSVREQMVHAVNQAIKSGVDLETEPEEVRARMLRARENA